MSATARSTANGHNRRRSRRTKSDLDSILRDLNGRGFDLTLKASCYEDIAASGITSANVPLAIVASQLLVNENPVTLRGLFYRVVSCGMLPSTDKPHYRRLGRLMTALRETGLVSFSWIVDSLRTTVKPSSWSGLNDYVKAAADSYRKDFWESLPEYVHIICEKDAIAGVLAPVTEEFDVALSPIRGYASLSFAHEIAETWNRIEKPIHAYYLGDFDPSGFDLERDIREKLERYCYGSFSWERLGVNEDDFETFSLISLQPKEKDRRTKKFIDEHGDRCAELDAIPATALRQRIRGAIESHIPAGEWSRLQEIEQNERQLWMKTLGSLRGGSLPGGEL